MRTQRDEGFTLIELLIVVAIISIIAAIAVPGLLRARMAGNETSAIASLKAVNSSQVAYSASCGKGNYAKALTTLGTGQFISPDMGTSDTPTKSGYSFTMAPATSPAATDQDADCNSTTTTSGYFATAIPTTYQTTGNRSFATDARNSVFQTFAGTAPSEPLADNGTTVTVIR